MTAFNPSNLRHFLLTLPLVAGCGPEREVIRRFDGPAASGGGPAASGGDASSTGGVAVGGSTGVAGAACRDHADCPRPAICSAGQCVACSVGQASCGSPCTGGQTRVAMTRNGCAICECAPPSECFADADCAAGNVCYRGAQCEDACSDLSCCLGNRCAQPGCDAAAAPCVYAGCAGGERCSSACVSPSCSCGATGWVCTDLGSGGQSGAGGACDGACVGL